MALPSLKGIHTFKVAAEAESFKLAAEQLFITQAAVSQQIRTLEQQLGCELFHRKTRKVKLTACGARLLPHVQRAFFHLQEGLHSIQDDPSPQCLTLSVLPSFATSWLLPRISDFQSRYPDITVRIEPNEQVANFETDHVDLAIRFGLGEYPNVIAELLASDSLVLAGKPGLIDKNNDLTQSLFEQPLIFDVCPDVDRGWQALAGYLGIDKAHLPAMLEIDNAAFVAQAAVAGQGVALLRRQIIQSQLDSGQLEVLSEFEYLCQQRYYLVAPAHQMQWHKVKVFTDWIRRQFT